MLNLQTIGSQLSTLQAYALAAIAFLLVPVALAGGASIFMRKKE